MHKKREKPQRLFSQGRGDRTRTCDSLVPNQERYQLRYTSLLYLSGCKGTNNLADKRLKTEKSFVFNIILRLQTF